MFGWLIVMQVFWWWQGVQFAERGILWQSNLVRWDHVKAYHWWGDDGRTLTIHSAVSSAIRTPLSFTLSAEQKAVAEQLLAQHVPKPRLTESEQKTEQFLSELSAKEKEQGTP